jgi:hypothetical protein
LGANPDDNRDEPPEPGSRHFAISNLFAWRRREPVYALGDDGRGHDTGDIEVVRVALLDRAYGAKLMAYPPRGRWATQQTGPCLHPTCTIARRTAPAQVYLVHERADEVEALSCGCACLQHGRFYARLFWTLAHLLGAEGIDSETDDRTLALPTAPRSSQAQDVRAWRKKRALIAEKNSLRPTITRISWGQLRYGKGRIVRDAEGAQVFVYEDEQIGNQTAAAALADAAAEGTPEAGPEATAAAAARDETEETDGQVSGEAPTVIQTHNRAHARLLIAGGGRRWKKTQLIPVRPSRNYVRAVSARHSGHSRTAVIGGPVGVPHD